MSEGVDLKEKDVPTPQDSELQEKLDIANRQRAHLEREKAKRDQKIAELESRNARQDKTLIEMAENYANLKNELKALQNTDASAIDISTDSSVSDDDSYEQLARKMKAAGITDKSLANEEDFYTEPTPTPTHSENLEKLGSSTRSAGIAPENAPVSEEEFYTPIVPLPPQVMDVPVDHLRDRQGEYNTQLGRLDKAIQQFAISRIEREKLLSGKKDKANIELMAGELNTVFGEWSQSLARLLAEQYKDVMQQSREVRSTLAAWNTELSRLDLLPEAERPTDWEAQLDTAEQQIRYYENWASLIDQRVLEVGQYQDTIVNNQLMSIRKRVDDAMTAEREKHHPLASKVNNWLRTHKKTRIAVGIGLAGMGIFGGVTGNFPLVATSVGLRAGLRGYGSYNAVRGAGDWLTDRKSDQYNSIDEYTKADQKRSARKRRWGRGAAVTSAALSAAPFAGSMLHGTEATPGTGGSQATSTPNSAPTPNSTPVAQTPNTLPGVSPESQESFARYLGATSKGPEAGTNFNRMFSSTPDQLAAMRGPISIEHMASPEWMQQAGITSVAARNQFNFLVGQASTSSEAQQQFLDNLPNTLNQLRGA